MLTVISNFVWPFLKQKTAKNKYTGRETGSNADLMKTQTKDPHTHTERQWQREKSVG